jgi:ribosomal protein L7/L12
MAGAHSQESLERHFKQINERLRAIEAQLGALSEQAGIDYEAPMAEVPQEVVELAEAGDAMGAMKRYRELTGAGADQAREVVQGL